MQANDGLYIRTLVYGEAHSDLRTKSPHHHLEIKQRHGVALATKQARHSPGAC